MGPDPSRRVPTPPPAFAPGKQIGNHAYENNNHSHPHFHLSPGMATATKGATSSMPWLHCRSLSPRKTPRAPRIIKFDPSWPLCSSRKNSASSLNCRHGIHRLKGARDANFEMTRGLDGREAGVGEKVHRRRSRMVIPQRRQSTVAR